MWTDKCRHDPRSDEIYEWIEPSLDNSEVTVKAVGECRLCGAFYTITSVTTPNRKAETPA